jgi:hypothetical protein
MTQGVYDSLGVWRTDPVGFSGPPAVVADLATAGHTLMGTGLALIEAFTKLIVRTEPRAASSPNKLLGCVQAQPGETEPPPHERAAFHKALFGWYPA